MSKSLNNVITRGATGTFGKQVVFSQRFGETIMSNHPGKRSYPSTDKQLQTMDRFKMANNYAKRVHASEALNAVYKAAAYPGLSAYNIAMSDAFKAPEIKEIDSSQYTGAPDDIIRIHAVDNFKVQSVYVTIRNGNNEIVEEGPAMEVPGEDNWIYTVVVVHKDLTGSKITVQASDLPGNTTMLEAFL